MIEKTILFFLMALNPNITKYNPFIYIQHIKSSKINNIQL
jgi:hypothetical protein